MFQEVLVSINGLPFVLFLAPLRAASHTGEVDHYCYEHSFSYDFPGNPDCDALESFTSIIRLVRVAFLPCKEIFKLSHISLSSAIFF